MMRSRARTINNCGAIVGTATADGNNPNFSAGSHGVMLIAGELAVDSNRDGSIDMANDASNPANAGLPVDTTSATQPFRFWLNNGVDGNETISNAPVSTLGSLPSSESVQGDLNPSANVPNYQYGLVTCTRDLENFARLWLYTKGLNTAISSGKIIVGLEWDSNTGDATTGWGPNDGAPAINIYAAAPRHGSSTVTGGADYLTDIRPSPNNTATDQANSTYGVSLGSVARGQPFYFNPATFANLTDSNPKTYFLFEGVASGVGRLIVTFNTVSNGAYTKIGQGGQVYMNLTDIKQLYERWTVGDGPNPNPSSTLLAPYSGGGAPLSQAQISTSNLPSGVTQGFQYSSSTPGLSVPSDPNGNKYILFVHGYNMEPWEKDAFAATALKRLYWQGYKGKFGAFQWPTTYTTATSSSQIAGAAVVDFDMGEYSAWLSAAPLKNLLLQLNGQYSNSVYVLAHSHGNIVMGEALRLAAQSHQNLVAGYVASQAAIPVQCYDSSQTTPSNFFGLVLPKLTPNIYVSWMGNNNAAVTSLGGIGNFYNPNDWALSADVWQTDERTKPDQLSGLFPPYGYTGDPNAAPVAQGFYNSSGYVLESQPNPNAWKYVPNWLSLANTNGINDQYEIMSFAAQAQCYALGTTATSAEGIVSTYLPDLWNTDPYNNNFSDHVWHSGEFEFSNSDIQIQNYWNGLLFQFNLLTPQ